MKLLIIIITVIIIPQYIFAQENIAENYIKQIDGKLDKAKAAIDAECLDNEKAKDPQIWYLKGYIYSEIAKSSVYVQLCDNPANVALKSIQKCYQLDTEKKYRSECVNALFEIGTSFYDQAIKAYNKGVTSKNIEYLKTALLNFEYFFETIATLGKDDKMIHHLLEYNKINPNSIKVYAGYSAQLTGDFVKAKTFYNELVDLNSDLSVAKAKGLPLAYLYLSDILISEQNMTEAVKVLERGVKLFPDNTNLVIAGIYLYFKTDKLDELAEMIELALQSGSSDINLITVLAGAYNKISRLYIKRGYESTAKDYREKAIFAYDKALSLNPEDKTLQFKLNYNCGLLYYNPAVKLYITNDENLKEEWTSLFTKSVNYLGKAHELDPTNRKLINILMKVYQCLNETDKAKSMEEKLYE